MSDMEGDFPFQHPEEEIANAVTHGLGLALSIAAAMSFLVAFRGGDLGLAISFGAYLASLSSVYLFSMLSHAVRRPRWKHRLRAWDQGMIYLLIAGTYSPFIWAHCSGTFRTALLSGVWAAAAVGFYTKVIAQHRVNALSTLTYILLGWLPAIPLAGQVSSDCLLWMAGGGVLYTVGVAFLKFDERVRFFHAVWHLCVIAASACHYYAILTFVIYPRLDA